MKPKNHSLRSSFLPAHIALSLGLAVAGVFSQSAQADTAWTGSVSQDWTDAANWSNGLPSPGNYKITINQIGINTPTLANSVSAGWDIEIGTGGNTGALNQSSGILATGNGNWGFIGTDAGSVGTYTLSGDAGFSASRIYVGANSNGSTGGTGTLNINTTGTVDAYGNNTGNWWNDNTWQIGSDTGSTGTINLVNGTVHSNGNMWLGAFSGTGILNQSGGTVNVGGNLALARMWNGSSGATVGTANISSGTLNAGSITGAYSGGGGDVTHGTLTVSGSGVVNTENDLVVAAGGTADSTGAVNINSGGTVNVATTTKRWLQVNQYDSVQGSVTVNGGNLNLNANTDIRFSTGWGGGGSGGTGASVVNLNSGAITSYSGNQTGSGSGVVDLNLAGGSVNNTFNLNGGTLTIGGIVATNRTGTRVFNFNGGTLKATGDSSTFFDSGVASAANVLDGGAIIDANGHNVAISQSLVGTGPVTIAGTSGRVHFSGANTYSGATTINAGTALEINASSGYSANSDYTVNGVLESYGDTAISPATIGALNGSGNVYNTASTAGTTTFTVGANGHSGSFSGVIANGAWGGNVTALVKSGAGTQTLSGTNTYTGATTVTNGKLVVNGSISTSAVTVQSGATLGGMGTVGALTVESGGTVAPGNSPGILTVNGNYNQAGTLSAELNGTSVGDQYDQVHVTGTVTLSGALAATVGYTPANGDILFILAQDGTDAINGTFADKADGSTFFLNGTEWKISYEANYTGTNTGTFTGGNDVALMAIPEPRAALLGGLGMLALLRRRRQ